jgi:hypothetical protein
MIVIGSAELLFDVEFEFDDEVIPDDGLVSTFVAIDGTTWCWCIEFWIDLDDDASGCFIFFDSSSTSPPPPPPMTCLRVSLDRLSNALFPSDALAPPPRQFVDASLDTVVAVDT